MDIYPPTPTFPVTVIAHPTESQSQAQAQHCPNQPRDQTLVLTLPITLLLEFCFKPEQLLQIIPPVN